MSDTRRSIDSVDNRATVDFDHHSREWMADRHAQWATLRREAPVAYNPNYGGFWIVSGYDELVHVTRDADTFTSRYAREPRDGIQLLGIMGVPRVGGTPPLGVAEVDGPLHQALRRVLNPFLLPGAVARLEPFMRDVTTWFLDQKIESGAIDLVLDLANPVPAVLTMAMIGLPVDRWERYGELFHVAAAYRPSAPEYQHATTLIPGMISELLAAIADRRATPRPDMLSDLVHTEMDGRHLTDDELLGVLWNLIGGGLDTTTSLTALALHHLDEDAELRRQLIDQPTLIVSATEEFLRYYSVNETLTRTVTRDCELGGQQLRKGDYLLISWLSANHDERHFADSGRVVLERQPNRHLAFGLGLHRCIGMHIARSMFQIILAAVLERIPDYAIDRDATVFYHGNPELFGVVTMPATFTAGPRAGATTRPF